MYAFSLGPLSLEELKALDAKKKPKLVVTDVRVGQVWMETDPRAHARTFKILSIEGEKALVQNCRASDGSLTAGKNRILLRRFRSAGQRGYRLLKGPDNVYV